MTSPPWPEWLNAVWAKSVSGRPEQEGESLARHTWSVLTTFSQMVRLHPWLPEYLGKPGLWNSLFWACWLHDLGKSCGQFQTMLRGGPKWGHRHEVLSLLFLDWVAPCLSDEESIWVAASVASHHKDAGSIFHLYPLPVEGVPDSLDGLVKDIPLSSLQGIRRWILECSEPWIRHLGLSEHGIEVPHMGGEDQIESLRQDGASRIHCWLRAYRRWWDRLDRGDDNRPRTASLALRGHINTSDHVASAHVATQVRGIGADAGQLLLDWRMDPEKLYEHQKQSLDTRGNALLVAPTGSGKTEAALLWAVGQARQGSDVPRLFYMLPYQASMNAMYNRLNSGHLLDQVGLEHSRSVLALYRYHLEEDASPAQAERDSRAAKNLARLHQYPVRVLSPYQLLKGPYRIRGYEALLND